MRSSKLVAVAALLVLPAAAGIGRADEPRRDDPQTERHLMEMAPGFEMQLVASEPDVRNPIAMSFDARGRLWVACAPRYPQVLPGQAPGDYILVLDDFDKTGKARSVRVFADGLTMPTGLAVGDGGVYVGQGDSLWHLRDSTGSGKADERRQLLTGFGTQDTHHTLNTFRWGPDGALYFDQGVYIKSTVETPWGPRRHFGGCIWRLQPASLRLEVFDRSILDNNTWGHVFDRWGRSLVASAWPDGINVVLPDSPLHKDTEAALVTPLGLTRIGGGRHCGAELVSGRYFPADWQGNLLTGDFLTHRVQRYRVDEDGGRLRATPLPPLVVSRHPRFRPVDVKMGLDGAVYVADLYQEIIQHNQINFRDPRRDHEHGRIWRIVRKDRPLLPCPQLIDVPIARVLDHLRDPEQVSRALARRTLAEKPRKEVVTALSEWVKELTPRDSLQQLLLEALWTYQTIGVPEPALLSRLLRSSDARVRAAATRVLGDWYTQMPTPARLLAVQASDPDPRVRLEAVLAAGRIPSAEAADAALRALDQPLGPQIDFALRRTLVVLEPYWYPPLKAGRFIFGERPETLAFVLKAAPVPEIGHKLAGLLQAGRIRRESRADVLIVLAAFGSADEQALALDGALAADELTSAERIRVLEALQAARQKAALDDPRLSRLAELFASSEPALAAAALRLAGAWKVDRLRPQLEARAAGAAAPPSCRHAAVQALVDLGGAASRRQLQTLAARDRPHAVRVEAIAGLAALDLSGAATLAASLLHEPVGPGEDPSGLFAAFLQRKGGSAALTAALGKQPPSTDAARVGLRLVLSSGVPAAKLVALLQTSAGEAGRARKLDSKEERRLLDRVKSQGDPARGEMVFRRPALSCLSCHAIAGAGGKVGPDLATVGASAPLDYLLESVLLPGKIVKDGYASVHLVTRKGEAFSGIVLRETLREMVLRDATHDELTIPLDAIEERAPGGSLMPEGLDQTLTDAELADLVRFLSELGKPGPYGPSQAAVARSWQYLNPPLAWAPAYSLVSGDLPLAEVAVGRGGLAVLRCRLEVAAAGKVQITFNSAQGLEMWIDGAPVAAAERITRKLSRGTHTIDLRIQTTARKESRLRCGVVIPAGSSAQAVFSTGR